METCEAFRGDRVGFTRQSSREAEKVRQADAARPPERPGGCQLFVGTGHSRTITCLVGGWRYVLSEPQYQGFCEAIQRFGLVKINRLEVLGV